MASVGDGTAGGGGDQVKQPEIIKAEDVTSPKEARPYHEEKDQRITALAILVIKIAAIASVAALLLGLIVQLFYPNCTAAGVCTQVPVPEWPGEMFRLSLVASLAFVMGGSGKQ